MPEWLTILIVVASGTAGTGGLWGGARWLVAWSERRSDARHVQELALLQKKHDCEAAIATRVETMQTKFLETLDAMQRRLDDERKARLEQALNHAATLAETTQRLLDATERMAPGSPTPTTGTRT